MDRFSNIKTLVYVDEVLLFTHERGQNLKGVLLA